MKNWPHFRLHVDPGFTKKPVAKAKAPRSTDLVDIDANGARYRRKARSSGATVATYDLNDPRSKPVGVGGKRINPKPPTEKETWIVVCETHGGIGYFEKLRDATFGRKAPEAFCPGCAEAVAAKANG